MSEDFANSARVEHLESQIFMFKKNYMYRSTFYMIDLEDRLLQLLESLCKLPPSVGHEFNHALLKGSIIKNEEHLEILLLM